MDVIYIGPPTKIRRLNQTRKREQPVNLDDDIIFVKNVHLSHLKVKEEVEKMIPGCTLKILEEEIWEWRAIKWANEAHQYDLFEKEGRLPTDQPPEMPEGFTFATPDPWPVFAVDRSEEQKASDRARLAAYVEFKIPGTRVKIPKDKHEEFKMRCALHYLLLGDYFEPWQPKIVEPESTPSRASTVDLPAANPLENIDDVDVETFLQTNAENKTKIFPNTTAHGPGATTSTTIDLSPETWEAMQSLMMMASSSN